MSENLDGTEISQDSKEFLELKELVSGPGRCVSVPFGDGMAVGIVVKEWFQDVEAYMEVAVPDVGLVKAKAKGSFVWGGKIPRNNEES